MPKSPRRPAHISLTAAKAFGVPRALYADVCGVPGYDPFRDVDPRTHFFDAEAAQLRLDFFPECLTHVKGECAGKPFVLAHWQRAIVVNLFGWMHRHADGPRRRYRKCLIYVAKKNGKTTFAAGLALAFLFLDDEPGAEVYSAGESKDQGAYAWKQAVKMVQNDEALSERARIYGARGGSVQQSIHYEERNSAYKIIASDSDTQDGFNPHAAIVDEVHRFKSREFIDLIEDSQIGRRNGCEVLITTADYERVSPCNSLHDQAIKARDGTVPDPEFLPVVFEASPDDDWRTRETWEKANPSLGIAWGWDACERLIRKAEAEPSYLNTMKRLHLNIVTKQVTRWLPMDKWRLCTGPTPAGEMREALKGRRCWGGLDLSATRDLSAFLLLFPRKSADDKLVYDVLLWYWIPQVDAAQREKDDRIPYLLWAEQGFVELTEGNSIDYQFIRRRINHCWRDYDVQDIGFDKWNAREISAQLQDEDKMQLVEVPQVVSVLSEPSKRLETLVVSGGLSHGGNPVLEWNASNAAIKRDVNENIRPVKDGSPRLRIDGISALITALARFMVSPPPAVPTWTIFTGEEGEDE